MLAARAVLRAVTVAAPVRAVHVSAVALAEKAAATTAGAGGVEAELILNLAAPSRSLVAKKAVKRVTLPGREGVFGVEKNSPPMVSELQPGVVRVDHMDNSIEEFFVPGGFSFKHASNVIDVSCPEGVKLDQVDVDALRAANADATKKRDAAAPGSAAQAEIKVALDVFRKLSQVRICRSSHDALPCEGRPVKPCMRQPHLRCRP